MKISKLKHVAIFSTAIASMLAGCSEEVNEGAYRPDLKSHFFSISPRDFEFISGEETKKGTIKSESDWSFDEIPDWLSMTPTSGSSNTEFSITSGINAALSSRTAVFNVSTDASDWSQHRTVTATQAAATPVFRFVDLENTTLYLNGESHTVTINVESNLEDLAVKTYDGEGWLNSSYQNKQLKITVAVNDNNTQRTGRVEVWSPAFSKGGSITITQYKPNLSFNEITSLSFEADGGTQSVTVTSEIPWIASSDESWIDVEPSKGNGGSNQVKITVIPSYQSGNRNGKIHFSYNDNQSAVGSISISQSGRYLDATPKSITLSADENNSAILNIDSNIGWEIASCPEWITLNPNKGNGGNTEIIITAQKSNSLTSRSGTIKIKDSMTGGIETSLTVVQNGLDFEDKATLEFDWRQSSKEFDILLPGAWNSTVSDEWISLSEYYGNGNKKIMVSTSRNDSEDIRTGKITISSEGKTMEIEVIQAGQYLTIDNTSGEFNAIGGSLSLTIVSSINTSCDIEYSDSGDNWIHVDQIKENEYSINVDFNPSIKERTAFVRFLPTETDTSDKYAHGVKCSIKQSGRVLTTDQSKIIMLAKGGTSDIIHVISDGGYSIEKKAEEDWYSITQVENGFYLIVDHNNTTTDRTGHVTIMLKDLPEGEEKSIQIEVIQYKSTINIEFYPFDEDEDWNP